MGVKVYSTPTCPYCRMAKDFLKHNKIPFEDIDVSVDKKLVNEMFKRSGQLGVPVIDINGKVIVGFDKEALRKELKIK
ncbi:MAG: glutathione S-transferase N-terminal domain-containing protein [Candidatus Micrarchaeota archaeon]|nr:glutathione S-transferase N-terminal domain-containing protein [Candidatus Micrarchaeota archaeon]